jgi:hypothetical protein
MLWLQIYRNFEEGKECVDGKTKGLCKLTIGRWLTCINIHKPFGINPNPNEHSWSALVM